MMFFLSSVSILSAVMAALLSETQYQRGIVVWGALVFIVIYVIAAALVLRQGMRWARYLLLLPAPVVFSYLCYNLELLFRA